MGKPIEALRVFSLPPSFEMRRGRLFRGKTRSQSEQVRRPGSRRLPHNERSPPRRSIVLKLCTQPKREPTAVDMALDIDTFSTASAPPTISDLAIYLDRIYAPDEDPRVVRS